jgi:hypothetical protein
MIAPVVMFFHFIAEALSEILSSEAVIECTMRWSNWSKQSGAPLSHCSVAYTVRMSPTTPAKPPLLFISHKHSDWRIARELSQFLKKTTANQLRIHLSSGSDDEAPEPGRILSQQLRNKLWESEALILVYTDSEKDWGYCLWECGVATLPESPDTNAIVMQCGDEPPAVYEDLVRVKATDLTALKTFVKQLCRNPKFFRSRTEPLTRLSEKDCDEAAQELHTKLNAVIRDHQRSETWSPWPLLRVSLSDDVITSLAAATDKTGMVRANARVTGAQNGVLSLFGLGKVSPATLLADLARVPAHQNGGQDWLDSAFEQLADCALYVAPVVKAVTLRASGAEAEYTPVVTSMRRVFIDKIAEFEICFYNLSDPRGIPVILRMVPTQKLVYKSYADISHQKLSLLIDELEERSKSRLPVFGALGEAKFVVHRATMEQHLLKTLRAKVEEPTLEQLLGDARLSSMFGAFCVVGRRATIADARARAATIPGCQDVFVTETGSPEEPVLGYLTNVDLARPSGDRRF